MNQVLKNLQLGVGFLVGLFAMLLLGIGVIAGIEALIEKPLPFKIPILLVLAVVTGVLTARWVAQFDLSRFVTAREKKPEAPPPPPKIRPTTKKRPWTFYLVGTLITFWAVSLVMIIVLFGPFGFADDPSLGIRLAKMAACTVAIAGLGGFLLRKEFAKLMSDPQK
jgi:MFS family permease